MDLYLHNMENADNNKGIQNEIVLGENGVIEQDFEKLKKR